jgi:hypothetical protein
MRNLQLFGLDSAVKNDTEKLTGLQLLVKKYAPQLQIEGEIISRIILKM